METPENGSGRLPQLQIDQLLAELQARIEDVRGTRDRIHSLLEAVMSVGQGLELTQVLRRIVEAAAVLVDAEYGALGVIGDREQLAQFLPVGMSDEQIGAIGPLPSGHGILGELIRHPQALRLTELADHPASYGFPPNHPPMHSFLGVPIRVRNEVFGNIYLTEKRGGKDFDVEDETVLSTLAVAAGVAIENARAYEESRRRQRWLEANADVVSQLLSGAGRMSVLELVVDRARQILEADLGVLTLPVPGTDDLRVALTSGPEAAAFRRLTLPLRGSLAGVAADAVEPVASSGLSDDDRFPAHQEPWTRLGPAVAVRMGTSEGIRGVLLLARPVRSAPFGEAELAPLLTFAGQAAIAMELAERRDAAQQLALLEDHERIARDLHDLAIQRLFAAGMTLQSTLRIVTQPQASERMQRVVRDLDDTISIIRSTIFGLRPRDADPGRPGLRARAASAVEEAATVLGFSPGLRMEGLLDTDVPADIAEHALAVLGEALSNTARHADARTVDVALTVRAGTLTVGVTDDGVGLPADGGRRSGLRNLEERAQRLGGTITVGPGSEGGTRLVWSVPTDAHRHSGSSSTSDTGRRDVGGPSGP
ncbi:GAF domain-containing protein [Streptomyces sp. NPDC051940]|uniref:GAF domain-containing sensor histidine kinase n=1 Tax=Streptomyces sp. NPDC051940 TaxID=3155675 RepID=UPI00342F6901